MINRIRDMEKRIEQLEKEGLPMNHNNRNNLLVFVGMCFTVILLSCFLLTLIGVIDLRIVNEIEVAPWVDFAGNSIMFVINMFFIFSICLLRLDINFLNSWLLYSFFVIFLSKIINIQLGFFTSVVGTGLVLILISCKLKQLKLTIIIYGFLFILISIVTFCFNMIKFDILKLEFIYKPNILVKSIYSIDLYLVYIWAFIYAMYNKNEIKGVISNATLEICFWSCKFFKISCKKICKISFSLTDEERNEFANDTADLSKKQSAVYCRLIWVYTFMQAISIIVISRLINKFFFYLGFLDIAYGEIIICIMALEISRRILGKTYHNKSPLICNAISLFVICLISRLIMPLQISLFIGVVVSTVFALVIHVMVVKDDTAKENELKLQEYIESAERKEKNKLWQGIPKNVIIEQAGISNLDDYQTELLIWKWCVPSKNMKEVLVKADTKYGYGKSKVYQDIKQAEIKIQS